MGPGIGATCLAWAVLAGSWLPDPTLESPPSEVLLEARIGDVASGRILAWQDSSGALVLPIPSVFNLAGLRFSHTDSLVNATIEPSRDVISIDMTRMLVHVGSQRLSFQPGQLAVYGGVPHAALELLARLLGVRATVEWESATIHFHGVDHLPVALRAARERERARLAAAATYDLTPGLVLPSSGGTFESFALDYRLGSSGMDPVRGSTYDLSLFTDVVSGSAVLRVNGSISDRRRWAGSWSRTWPGARGVGQLRIGDMIGAGPRPRATRGLAITNAPVDRPLVVEHIPFAGTLPPDWVIEAYRGGALVGFDSVGSGGAWHLTLPVYTGENGVDFRAYGPHGEVRVFDRAFRVVPGMIPSGNFEYGLSAGVCASGSSCDEAGVFDLRYGLSRRASLRAGIDALSAAREWSVRPYFAAVSSPINSVGVEIEAMHHAFRRANLRLEPTPRLIATAAFIAYDDNVPAALGLPRGVRRERSLYGRWLPGAARTRLVIEAQLDQRESSIASGWHGRLAATVRGQGFQLRPSIDGAIRAGDVNSAGHPLLGLETTILPRGRFGLTWIRSDLRLTSRGELTYAELTATTEAIPRTRLELGSRWRDRAGAVFTLQIRRVLLAARAATTVSIPDHGESRVAHTLEGSVLWDGSGGGLTALPDRAHGQSAIAGRVFLDIDGDGRRSEFEPGVPNVRLAVGSIRVTTDGEGMFKVPGLPSYTEVRLAIEPASLETPWWFPAYRVVAVTPGSDPIRHVDLPLSHGAVLEGTVRWAPPDHGSASMPTQLLLIELATNDTLEVDVLADGSFFAMAVRPGEYALRARRLAEGTAYDELCPARLTIPVSPPPPGRVDVYTPAAELLGLRITLGASCPVTVRGPSG